jgi:hypothetical protein
LLPLENPVRDATDLFEAINKCPDCRAAIVRDPPDRSTIINHLKNDFLKKLAALPANKLPDVVALVLGGHGMQHDSNVFLIPARAECDSEKKLKDNCLSHMTVLKCMLDDLDSLARQELKEVKFVLIMDMCRDPGAFDRTDTIGEPDQNKAPGRWCICYSTSRGSSAADGAPGSNSPLVLGLMDPQSGIFAPGVSLYQGIIHACESVEKLSGVDMRQRSINVNIHYLGNVVLQARPLSEEMEYEIVAYLKSKGLDRIAKKVSEGLGIEKIQHLKHVDEELIRELDGLKPLQRKILLEICREVAARRMSDDNHLSGDDTPPPKSETQECLVAARNGGDCADFQEHMRYFLKDFDDNIAFLDPEREIFHVSVGKDSLWGEWTMCMLLWTGFAQSQDATLDKSLRDKWLEVSKEPDQVIFLSTLTDCLMHPATTHPRWALPDFKSCKCQKENAAGIFFTDRVVQHALCGNKESKERWKNEVVKDWFENKADTDSDFLIRANRFLREDLKVSIKGMSIFEWVVETQSYVVFIKMSGLAASLLFGYLEARKLDFVSAAGAAGGSRTLLHGFTRFVSSEGHAFSLNNAGVPALHVIVEGLQGMLHLAHTCWEMMGPVKTAQAFLVSEEKEDEEITSAVELPPKQPLTEPLAAGVFVCADTVSQVRL